MENIVELMEAQRQEARLLIEAEREDIKRVGIAEYRIALLESMYNLLLEMDYEDANRRTVWHEAFDHVLAFKNEDKSLSYPLKKTA